MEWEKASKDLGKLLGDAIPPLDCQTKIMFGAPVYVVNHNMFAGVHGNNIFIRLSEPDKKELIKGYPQATPFEPVKGHIMRDYLIVPPELYKDKPIFRKWLQRSYYYAASIPTKGSKKSQQ